jgi:hypothetical protein
MPLYERKQLEKEDDSSKTIFSTYDCALCIAFYNSIKVRYFLTEHTSSGNLNIKAKLNPIPLLTTAPGKLKKN